MHLDARDCRIDRGGFQIQEPDRRRANQDKFSGKTIWRHIALQYVFGRDVSRRIVFVEVHPELAVAIGRQFETGDGDGLNAGVVYAHQDSARTGDDAE